MTEDGLPRAVPALAMTGRGTGGLIARATDRKKPRAGGAVRGGRSKEGRQVVGATEHPRRLHYSREAREIQELICGYGRQIAGATIEMEGHMTKYLSAEILSALM